MTLSSNSLFKLGPGVYKLYWYVEIEIIYF